jgi:hypothetical protein
MAGDLPWEWMFGLMSSSKKPEASLPGTNEDIHPEEQASMNHDMSGQAFICVTCGTEYSPRARPPSHCAICTDDRQYVGAGGQQWTTHEALVAGYRARFETAAGIECIGMQPGFAIDQRAFLLQGRNGNVLWECVSRVDEAIVDRVKSLGGISTIAISHPHFYSAMAEWSRAFGGVPIVLHADDREWVQYPEANIEYWTGDTMTLDEGITLIRCGEHFAGSSALHMRDAADGRGALFSSDALQVVADCKHVSFMYSYPNLVPLSVAAVDRVWNAVKDFAFENVHGFTWGRDILGNGHAVVRDSVERYRAALARP